MSLRSVFRLGLLCALVSTPVLAGDYKFTMHNESQYPIRGFETFEAGKWTKWENVKVDPGESQEMTWTDEEGGCKVPFRIIYKDVETEEYTIDWCKVTNIHVKDDEVFGN